MLRAGSTKRSVPLGVLSGLVGGVAAVLILWGAWMLPVLGLLLTGVNLSLGAVVVLVLSAVGGLVYGLVYPLWSGRKHPWAAPPGAVPLAVSGLLLGAVMWLAGPLALIPLALGFPAFPAQPSDQVVSLTAFLAYGAVTAFVFGAGREKTRVAKAVSESARGPAMEHRHHLTQFSITLIALSAAAALFLLRSAHSTDPAALELRQGYRAEVVATGLTYPTSLAIASDGRIYIGEAGFTYGPKETVVRILTISPEGATSELARDFEGPLNGLALRGDDLLYVSHRGKVTVLTLVPTPDGQLVTVTERRDLVTGLPSLGDHHNNDLAFSPAGELFLGQGTATNAGVVGSDNFVYAWADRFPEFHDIPSRDFTLTDTNYSDLDLRTLNPADRSHTGAFAPFGQERAQGEMLTAGPLPSGAILRVDPDTGDVSVYADGLRNPYGLAFAPNGALYATNLGYDDRGVRAVKQSPDWLVRVTEGAWYGWPDYAGVVSLSDARFSSERGVDLRPLITDPPPVEAPLAEFGPHTSPMKVAVSPGGPFGDRGGVYVALFGDAGPLTENLPASLATQVLRVDPETGRYETFLQNRASPRAGRYGQGLKRAIGLSFCLDGNALYVLDFGQIETTDLAPNAIPETGVLWRVVRDDEEGRAGRSWPAIDIALRGR